MRLGLFGAAAAAILALFLLVVPFWRRSSQFADAPTRQPSRLYESPLRIASGDRMNAIDLAAILVERGYRESEGGDLPVGRFRADGSELAAHLRGFPTPSGWSRPALLEVSFSGRAVRRIEVEGRAVKSAWIDPLPLATYFSPDLEDRWPIRIERLPRFFLMAVLAAEDAAFFNHPGLSPSGIGRALLVNLRGGEVIQGGSTLTQQLVKNLYLTQERTLGRKAREAVLALFLELRYDKRRILEAYLNEIFFGRIGPVNLVGVGSAARTFFGVPAEELTLSEAALVAGVIRSPSRLSPLADREAAVDRRNEVLDRMLDLGWIDGEQHQAAVAEPAAFRARTLDLRRARYAADSAATEVRRRFGLEGLEEGGYSIVSSLSFADQVAAETIVAEELSELESRSGASEGLQAVLMSAEPATGRVLAWVGGRDYASSQYDRVRFAKRQPGSAFKPLILAAAFSERSALPSSLLVDEPITVRQGKSTWSPKNDDRQHHGVVSVRETIERSLNVPTVRLALDVGLESVVDWSHRLGIESELERLPSLALGAFEVTPLEMLQAYSTIAAGGRESRLHLVDAVLAADGATITGTAVGAPEPILEPAVAFMITSVLEGVVDRGTGRRLRSHRLYDRLAAKTGTSSSGRDAWLIGYAPERSTLVWVGYDEGSAGGLSGSRSALPLFARFMKARRPAEGYSVTQPPADVVTVTVDPLSGGIATGACPLTLAEVFFADRPPRELCPEHGRGRGRWWRWRRDRSRGEPRAGRGDRGTPIRNGILSGALGDGSGVE